MYFHHERKESYLGYMLQNCHFLAESQFNFYNGVYFKGGGAEDETNFTLKNF